MSSKAMSLKGKIKNYAKSNNIAAQVVLQNYMFECFLSRLSVSEYSDKFEEDIRISLWGYNIETVIAEKVETILRRGVFTTRPRDYYDVYILGTTQKYDKEIYQEALKATAEHRGSTEQISDTEGILKQISESDDLKEMWSKYQKKFAYASDISYENALEVLKKLVL